MTVRFNVFLWLILTVAGNSVWAESKPIVEASIGVGFHEIEIGNNSSVTSVSEHLSFSLGYQLKNTLGLMGSFRFWNTEDNDGNDHSHQNVFHDFHFAGVSVGIDAQLFLPFQTQGPYIKAGHHCWTARAWEVINIFNDSGCSKLFGAGVLWNAEAGKSIFTEVFVTRFETVESWMLVVGGRF
jgi:hypothetical protein